MSATQKIRYNGLKEMTTGLLKARMDYAEKVLEEERADLTRRIANVSNQNLRELAFKNVIYWEVRAEVFARMYSLSQSFDAKDRDDEYRFAMSMTYLLDLLSRETSIALEEKTDFGYYRLSVMRKTIEDLFS